VNAYLCSIDLYVWQLPSGGAHELMSDKTCLLLKCRAAWL